MRDADVCTPESHERAKRDLAATLVHRGEQLDEAGAVELIYLQCIRCESTLGVEPANYATRYQERAA